MTRTLTHEQARAFYDRFGSRQDRQGFYEDAAVADLIAHARFAEARAVFEFGCGTGRFAHLLLTDHLAREATYRGIDISATMVGLARDRLAPWAERAWVQQTDGSAKIDAPDGAYDRFCSNYVLDLLSENDIRAVLAEARRVLEPGGLVCLTGLTFGRGPVARLVSAAWRAIYAISPKRVGGCRPIDLRVFMADSMDGVWRIEHEATTVRWGLSSQTMVASRLD